jgi:hypothetical protein
LAILLTVRKVTVAVTRVAIRKMIVDGDKEIIPGLA